MPFTSLDPAGAAPAPATTLGNPQISVGSTLATMRAALTRQLIGRTDIDPTTINEWINLSYVDLATSLDIDELRGSVNLTTVAGQHLYLLPASVYTIIGVSIQLPNTTLHGGYPLDKTDLSTYRSLILEDGEPTMYFRQGNLLVVYPTPEAARTLSVDCWIRPAMLAADTDSPLLGPEWHEVILLGARFRALSDSMEYEKALVVENQMIGQIRKRTDRAAKEQENRVIGSSAPRRLSAVRNRLLTRRTGDDE